MSKEDKKELNGKEFIASLEMCHLSKDVFELLAKTMDKDTLKDRLRNVNDNDLVVALNAQVAKFNAGQGKRTTHQDCVNMAADKYQQINNKKGIKFFKAELNKFMTAKEYERNAKELSAPLMAMRKDLGRS